MKKILEMQREWLQRKKRKLHPVLYRKPIDMSAYLADFAGRRGAK